MNNKMIEVHSHDDRGFKRLVEYKQWVAACLNDTPMYTPEGITYMEKHNLTDEVFILLKGKCTLFEAGNGDDLGEIHAVPLEPFKFYNVKAGVFHTHLLAPDTSVVVIENSDTGSVNSTRIVLNEEQKKIIGEMF